jgi:hypothetical protein
MIRNIYFVLYVGKCIRRIVSPRLRGVFVVATHSLRLDKCVLLYWMLCRCLGNSVLLGIVLLRFALLGKSLIMIQSFIICWLWMGWEGLPGRRLQFWIGDVCFVWVYSFILYGVAVPLIRWWCLRLQLGLLVYIALVVLLWSLLFGCILRWLWSWFHFLLLFHVYLFPCCYLRLV